MTELLLEPLHYAFMVRGMIAAVLVGAVCAVVGTFVVLRGMAFYGGALAHAILPGVAVGYIVEGGEGKHLFWWGMAAAFLSALGIGAVKHYARVKEDTAIGIIFAGMFALGIAIISTVKNYTADLAHFLFGDVLGVSYSDLVLTAVFSIVILLLVFLFFKEFLLISFDPVLAVTLRIPAKMLDFLLLMLIAMTVVVSLQTVGIALMIAMLVAPAATGYLLARRVVEMVLAGVVAATVSGIAGLYLSYYVSIASGAAIVIVSMAIFALTWGVKSVARSLPRVSKKLA